MWLCKIIFKLFLSLTKFLFKIKYFFLLILIAFLFWKFNSNGTTRILLKIKSIFEKEIVFKKYVENNFLSNISLNENIHVTSSKKKLNRKSTYKKDCNPIFTNSNQYSVLIDGVQYPTQVPLHKNVSINFECLDKIQTKKIILFYNTWFGSEEFSIGIGYRTPFIKSGCPVTSCETTNDKNRLNESDFVVTHMADFIPQLPNYRPINQRWIFFLDESPVYVSGSLNKFKSFYNYTATYRTDSDFPQGYQEETEFVWKEAQEFSENFNFSTGKWKLTAALISNCKAESHRLAYINQMQKYIQVDVYGACGKQCPDKFKDGRPGDCKQIIGAEYKFYLAFENSICKDYVTEKFFGFLKYNIIPVVLNGGSNDFYIPKSGFINALDFASPKHLAEYLIFLDKNSTAYNSYFKWKKHISFQPQVKSSPLCDMCIQLQLESFYGLIKPKVIHDLEGYWKPKGICKSPKIINDTFIID